MWRAQIGGQDQKSIFALDTYGGDHDCQITLVTNLVCKRLGHEPERLDIRQVRPADPHPPEHDMRDDGGELLPIPDGDLQRTAGRRQPIWM